METLFKCVAGKMGVPRRNPHIFPGPQPISIERIHFDILKQNDYFVCEKSDGTRYALLCTKWNTHKVSVIINRGLHMYIVKNKFKPNVYEDTVADMELVKAKNTWLALMYDVVHYQKNVKNLTLLQRLECATEIQKSIRRVKGDTITFVSKPMFPLKEIKVAIEGTKDHVSDGLIFTPVNEPIKFGTHETMFKWKPKYKNTIDFLVKRQIPNINLYVQERGVLMFESQIPLQSLTPEWNTRLQDGTIVECAFNDKTANSWIPVLIRTDKTHPNNRRTFYRTLTNIAENITQLEFLNLLKKTK